MANPTALKRRIRSVRSTKQITKAMELVSASKMRRAQEAAARSREYNKLAQELLTHLRELTDVDAHPLYKERQIKTKTYIVITSDRSLAGAYNANVLRFLSEKLVKDAASNITCQLITIGKQGAHFVSKLKDVELLAVYADLDAQSLASEIAPILQNVTESYRSRKTDSVEVIFTDYISSLRQIVTAQTMLPVAFSPVPVNSDLSLAVFEPSPMAVLENITERLLEVQMAQAVLESQASEHSMRMMAMKSASDNATDIIDDLTLAFNTARQASITQEIAEITGGAEAIK